MKNWTYLTFTLFLGISSSLKAENTAQLKERLKKIEGGLKRYSATLPSKKEVLQEQLTSINPISAGGLFALGSMNYMVFKASRNPRAQAIRLLSSKQTEDAFNTLMLLNLAGVGLCETEAYRIPPELKMGKSPAALALTGSGILYTLLSFQAYRLNSRPKTVWSFLGMGAISTSSGLGILLGKIENSKSKEALVENPFELFRGTKEYHILVEEYGEEKVDDILIGMGEGRTPEELLVDVLERSPLEADYIIGVIESEQCESDYKINKNDGRRNPKILRRAPEDPDQLKRKVQDEK